MILILNSIVWKCKGDLNRLNPEFINKDGIINHLILRIGVNVKDMLYIQLDTVEDIFEVIENITSKVRESNKDRMVTIVVDSVAAATTRVEQEADYSKDGWATSKAIVLSKAMRKITQLMGRQKVTLVFTNQLRVKLGAMFGDPYTTSGGKALGFHASCRLRLQAAGQIKAKVDGKDQVIGIKTKAKIIKNRMGPPLRTAEFDIFFDSGVDNFGGWLTALKNHKLISQGGSWYTYTDDTGKAHKFLSKDWNGLLEGNDELRDEVYNKICDAAIMEYKTDNLGIDDIELSTEAIPE